MKSGQRSFMRNFCSRSANSMHAIQANAEFAVYEVSRSDNRCGGRNCLLGGIDSML